MIRHVLLDADGVLQEGTGRLDAGLAVHLGGDDAAMAFLKESFSDDVGILRGEVELVELLRPVLPGSVDVDAFYTETSLAIDVLPHTHDLITDLRGQGYGVHLGTNQDSARARFMRTGLGYDDLFDVSCYSCDLGAAKPSAAFFEKATALIGADPAEIVFVDDNEENVVGARAVGLHGIHWHYEQGLEKLGREFAAVGVSVRP